MNNRFQISEIRICPFGFTKEGALKPNLEYPFRKCVIDKEKGVAVDIELNIQYDYLPTVSNLYFLSNCRDKIKDNRRVAVFPLASNFYDNDILSKSHKIIKRLVKNEDFIDGNEYLNNEAYLEFISQKETSKKKKFTIFKRN